jgi:cation diffusion facilitator family transporter
MNLTPRIDQGESVPESPIAEQPHDHVFLGAGHARNERKTWAVIILCTVMMVVEIVGGSIFGSLALVADGWHMSTHAGAMLIAALAYTYARRHATDNRFVFGTGKLGDLAGFTSAIVLAIISLLIGYEAVLRLFSPVTIEFGEAIPIAIVGLMVNIASAWLLSGGEHHSHGHHARHDHHSGTGPRHTHERAAARGHAHSHADHESHDHDSHQYDTSRRAHGHEPHGHDDHGAGDAPHSHDHGAPAQATTRDNSIRSAYVHVLADAFISLLAIAGLVLARSFGWLWLDPVAGIVGALVIANWAVTLIRDTAVVLLDVCPDEITREKVRSTLESDGDRVIDLHLWRLGPGHLAAVLAIATSKPRDALFYRNRLSSFECLSHVTVEVTRPAAR